MQAVLSPGKQHWQARYVPSHLYTSEGLHGQAHGNPSVQLGRERLNSRASFAPAANALHRHTEALRILLDRMSVVTSHEHSLPSQQGGQHAA